MSNQVWVCGEVLIDLIPDGTERRPVVGGGPANTAKALAKLGITTQFIDGISNDIYGQMAADELLADDVLLDYVKYSDKPTCLAIVSLSKSGGATYEFVIDDTATLILIEIGCQMLHNLNLHFFILEHLLLLLIQQPQSYLNGQSMWASMRQLFLIQILGQRL